MDEVDELLIAEGVACDDLAVARGLAAIGLEHAGLAEQAGLAERTLVDEQREPLLRIELAGGLAFGELGRAAHGAGLVAAAFEFFEGGGR